MPCNVCLCGAQAGYMHASDCPSAYFGNDPERVQAWLEERAELRAAMAWALGECERLAALTGAAVWYYDRNAPEGWKRATLAAVGQEDGYPIVNVTLGGVRLFGYGWQIASGEAEPPAPDLGKFYPRGE